MRTSGRPRGPRRCRQVPDRTLKIALPRAENPSEPGRAHPLKDETVLTTQTHGRWLAVLLLVAYAPAAGAGVIRGTVRLPALPRAPVALQPYAGNANALPDAAPPVQGLAEDAVIYVESLAPAVADSLPSSPLRPRLVQEHQSFVPHVLPVAVGTAVDFPNRDAIYHNVFSLSPVQRFDLGKYPRGQSRQVRFRKAGLVRVFCDIHSNMEAFIVVLPNRAFTQPDAAGAFTLPDLPPGTYRLVLWHPDFGEARATAAVPDSGDVRVALGY